MVATQPKPQRLSARDDAEDVPQGSWGPVQIATPAIVGGVLLLLFAAYIIWHRRTARDRAYDYHQVRSSWASKMGRIFTTRRARRHVRRSSAPVTLDDSMRTSGVFRDPHRLRQSRSGSYDSQTPLTANYAFDYPPNPKSAESSPPTLKRPVRWWWPFWSRPQEIKSAEPSLRWCVDGSDGSSSGHDREEYRPRYVGGLEPMREEMEEADLATAPIVGTFPRVTSPLAMQRAPVAEQVRSARGTPDLPASIVARAPVPTANTPLQGSSGTPVSSGNRGLPPSYDVSQSQTVARHPSMEEMVRLARSESYVPVVPLPSRTVVYAPSPRGFHGRDLSSDSFLVTTGQSPMTVATTLY